MKSILRILGKFKGQENWTISKLMSWAATFKYAKRNFLLAPH